MNPSDSARSTTLEYYDTNALELSRRYEGVDMGELHRWLLRWIPPGDRVLELGSGSGREAAFLERHGCTVTATDGSARMLRQTVRFHPELGLRSVQLVLPRRFPFPDEYFDSVLAAAVMMHLVTADISATLAEVRRVLKPEGRLLLSVPLSRRDVGENGRDDDGRRFTQLSAAQWHRLGGNAGLCLLSQRETEDGLKRPGFRWMNAVYVKVAPGVK